MSWDLWVDYHRTDERGLTHSNLRNARPSVALSIGQHIIVGNEEADPAVAEVVEISADGTVLVAVLPGSIDRNRHLITGQMTG